MNVNISKSLRPPVGMLLSVPQPEFRYLWGDVFVRKEGGCLGAKETSSPAVLLLQMNKCLVPSCAYRLSSCSLAFMKTTSEETTRFSPGAAYCVCVKPSCGLTEKLHQSGVSPFRDVHLLAAPVFGVMQAEVHPVSGQELERMWISKLEKCLLCFSMLILVSTGKVSPEELC